MGTLKNMLHKLFLFVLNAKLVECHQTLNQWVLSKYLDGKNKTIQIWFKYHLAYTREMRFPRNWICKACEASGPSPGREKKRSRRCYNITIFGRVPDHVVSY